MTSPDPIGKVFSALSDPTRRAILARLAQGEVSVGELAAPFDISLPAISRHLKVLETANLIVRERDSRWRRCRLRPAPLKAASDWIAQYRRFWEGRFDALAEYLDESENAQEEFDDQSNAAGRSDREPGRRS